MITFLRFPASSCARRAKEEVGNRRKKIRRGKKEEETEEEKQNGEDEWRNEYTPTATPRDYFPLPC